MNKLTHAVVVAIGMSLMAINPATASAAPDQLSAAQMPLLSRWRACDFTLLKWPDAVGYARAIADVSSSSGSVSATITMNTAVPNTHYDVRVIQTPRPSSGCGTGAPGVITGGLQTDGVGFGATTFQGPIESGATGAWVIVERPSAFSQTPAEFYTSTFIAAI